MKKILIVTHSFPPASTPASIRMLEICRHLSASHWEVHVWCPYSTYYSRTDVNLLGMVPDAVAVHRIKVWDLGNLRARTSKTVSANSPVLAKQGIRKKLWRLFGLLRTRVLYPDIYITWALTLLRTGKKICKEHKIDAIFATGDPWSVVLASSWLSSKCKVPFIADFRELWSGHSHRVDPTLIQWFSRTEQKIFKRSSLVVANSPLEAKILADSCKVTPPPRFIDIENGFNPDELQGVEAFLKAETEPYQIAYAGSFGYRKPDSFFIAVSKWMERAPDLRPNIKIVIAGLIEERVVNLVKSLKLESMVCFRGLCSRQAMIKDLVQSNLLLTIVGTPQRRPFDPTVPAKMYEYASIGHPILLLAKPGGATDFFHKIKSLGRIVDNEDTNGIMTALEVLHQEHISGRLSSRCHMEVKNYTREALTQRLAKAIVIAIEGKKA